MDKESSPECPYCAVIVTIDHIIWHCEETASKRLEMDITKEIWKGGRQVKEKSIAYVKEIEL
jgi:hypothetical protein